MLVGSIGYTREHEWVSITSVNKGKSINAKIGITDYAQSELGDVVFIELPEGTENKQYSKGEAFGTVESVKATSSVYAPVSMKVKQNNKSLLDDNSLINKSAEQDGWMVEVELTKPEEFNNLMNKEEYQKHVENSKH